MGALRMCAREDAEGWGLIPKKVMPCCESRLLQESTVMLIEDEQWSVKQWRFCPLCGSEMLGASPSDEKGQGER